MTDIEERQMTTAPEQTNAILDGLSQLPEDERRALYSSLIDRALRQYDLAGGQVQRIEFLRSMLVCSGGATYCLRCSGGADTPSGSIIRYRLSRIKGTNSRASAPDVSGLRRLGLRACVFSAPSGVAMVI